MDFSILLLSMILPSFTQPTIFPGVLRRTYAQDCTGMDRELALLRLWSRQVNIASQYNVSYCQAQSNTQHPLPQQSTIHTQPHK